MIAAALRAAIAAHGWDRDPPHDPRDAADYLAILTPLYETGRRDLPLGRLLEGHVDAVQIVRRYGSDTQVAALHDALAGGATLGVWNAALPGAPLTLASGRLDGGKGYASGAGVLTHALVTAQGDGSTHLLLLDLAATPPAIDRDWWRTTGMQRSETHLVRWRDATVRAADRIGAPDVYAREPFFSGGALRFVTVHAGGVAGLFDQTRAHLVATGRAADPFQAARLAELFQLADGAAAQVRRTATTWFAQDGEARLARVAATRLAVADAAERAIAVAQQAVGLSGHFTAHPLSALLADLSVYLRQPAPDAQRLRVGRAVADGLLGAVAMRLPLGGVRHAAIVAPHPDDEIIGAAALIRALRRRGARVTVVVVSDGAASHPGSRRWPRARLVAERRRESRRALHRLGVTAAAVRFLALPDGALADQPHCRRVVRVTLARLGAPDLIVGPARGDAHPDHRAVAAALAGWPGAARRLTYRVWPPQPRPAAHARSVIASAATVKRSLIRLHRTQSGAITDDPRGFAIARHELAVFAHPVERFVAVRR